MRWLLLELFLTSVVSAKYLGTLREACPRKTLVLLLCRVDLLLIPLPALKVTRCVYNSGTKSAYSFSTNAVSCGPALSNTPCH